MGVCHDMRELLSFTRNMSHSDSINHAYSYYSDYILASNDTRIKLLGKFLFIYDAPSVNEKPEMFWHLAGWENKQVPNVPRYNLCKNRPDWKIICGNNCSSLIGKIVTPHFGERTLCLYRMSMLPRILDIIELINNNQLDQITMWDFTSRSGRHKNEQLYVRYKDSNEDYVVIFQYIFDSGTRNINKMLLFGAFPVIFKYKRDELDRMERNSINVPKIKQVLTIGGPKTPSTTR